MNIREVAERTGLSAHTIRFYEKSGVLPEIQRSESGIRQFEQSDITFLEFVSALKKTGMTLQDIKDYTEDGCILERLKTRDIPVGPVARRVAILENHRAKLVQQRQELDMLIDAVNQKVDFYTAYLTRCEEREGPS